ncbi:MAG: hypothetical protein WCD13_13975 [Pseudolabrys sp.]
MKYLVFEFVVGAVSSYQSAATVTFEPGSGVLGSSTSTKEKPMPMSNDDDKRHMYTRWRNSEVSRNFHRLGLLVAAIILAAGLLLMAKDALGLRLWDLIPADIPILAGGIAIGLTGIGLVSLAAYGIVRAIGWAIDKSI